MKPRIAVVDAQNRFVRWEERRVIHEQRLPHRSAYVLLFDAEGRLVIQRRHTQKQTYPRHWDVSASGHVEEDDYPGYPEVIDPDAALDEVYAATALRELQEELGVTAALTRVGVFAPEPGVHYEHIHVFRAESDGPFVMQEDEVEELRRVHYDELDRMRREGALLTASLIYVIDWARARGLWG